MTAGTKRDQLNFGKSKARPTWSQAEKAHISRWMLMAEALNAVEKRGSKSADNAADEGTDEGDLTTESTRDTGNAGERGKAESRAENWPQGAQRAQRKRDRVRQKNKARGRFHAKTRGREDADAKKQIRR